MSSHYLIDQGQTTKRNAVARWAITSETPNGPKELEVDLFLKLHPSEPVRRVACFRLDELYTSEGLYTFILYDEEGNVDREYSGGTEGFLTYLEPITWVHMALDATLNG